MMPWRLLFLHDDNLYKISLYPHVYFCVFSASFCFSAMSGGIFCQPTFIFICLLKSKLNSCTVRALEIKKKLWQKKFLMSFHVRAFTVKLCFYFINIFHETILWQRILFSGKQSRVSTVFCTNNFNKWVCVCECFLLYIKSTHILHIAATTTTTNQHKKMLIWFLWVFILYKIHIVRCRTTFTEPPQLHTNNNNQYTHYASPSSSSIFGAFFILSHSTSSSSSRCAYYMWYLFGTRKKKKIQHENKKKKYVV